LIASYDAISLQFMYIKFYTVSSFLDSVKLYSFALKKMQLVCLNNSHENQNGSNNQMVMLRIHI